MKDELYSPYKLAIELGFTEAEAQDLDHAQADATNIRRVAEAKGLPSTKPKLGKPSGVDADGQPNPPEPEPVATQAEAVTKPHRHSYRKDGTCRCGAVRKVKALAAS